MEHNYWRSKGDLTPHRTAAGVYKKTCDSCAYVVCVVSGLAHMNTELTGTTYNIIHW